MEHIAQPAFDGYTLYSKSDCRFCHKAKVLLHNENYTLVECDKYIETDRDGFLQQMRSYTGRDHNTFPMVFKDGVFVGGCSDTENYMISNSEF